MADLLLDTEVAARGLSWEVFCVNAGRHRTNQLRCLEGSFRGTELDSLSPFQDTELLQQEPRLKNARRPRDWRTCHEALVLEQGLGV